MNHVNAMTGTVLGGAGMCQYNGCGGSERGARGEGALAAFLSAFGVLRTHGSEARGCAS